MILFIVIVFAALIIEAFADVHYGDSHGTVSNLILAATMLGMQAVGMSLGLKMGFLIYTLFRFCTFDYMYSYIKYRHIWYLGNTALMDKELARVNKYLLLGVRIIAILLLIILL